MNLKSLGLNIKKYRKGLKYTQLELAERTNLSTVHISHIENGSVKMSVDTLISMCNVLKVTPNDILEGQYEIDTKYFENDDLEGVGEKGEYNVYSQFEKNLDKMSTRERHVMLELSEIVADK